ncbi:hypothetical protein DFH06DRAFT_1120622 [Mycena polygramma]|nr:hypothetical protein DFH06DRAFT_1120622 [Mycena polygramma]
MAGPTAIAVIGHYPGLFCFDLSSTFFDNLATAPPTNLPWSDLFSSMAKLCKKTNFDCKPTWGKRIASTRGQVRFQTKPIVAPLRPRFFANFRCAESLPTGETSRKLARNDKKLWVSPDIKHIKPKKLTWISARISDTNPATKGRIVRSGEARLRGSMATRMSLDDTAIYEQAKLRPRAGYDAMQIPLLEASYVKNESSDFGDMTQWDVKNRNLPALEKPNFESLKPDNQENEPIAEPSEHVMQRATEASGKAEPH